jgi:coproporphyrinogen III oxidase
MTQPQLNLVETPKTVPSEAQKREAALWFAVLRDRICAAFARIEDELAGTEHAALPPGRFVRKTWQRAPEESDTGGGEMSIMRGRVFEKVGVNISTVAGIFSEDFQKQIPGALESNGKFWASGISVVAHLRSPHAPAVHMNARHIVTSQGWFGGGTDLTPMFPEASEAAEDKAAFHASLKTACDAHGKDYYARFSKWCDEYFYLPHRNETRGVGGIFYDYLDTGDWARDFAFTQDVGETFLDIYPRLVRRRMNEGWTPAQREHQLIRRGRYAEFNLLYDRGTVFGLKTGGNAEAILMSLPPEAKWP